MITKTCQQCGKDFQARSYEVKKGLYKFCSQVCKAESQKGKIHTEDRKAKIGESVRKYRIGKKHSEETKKKMSLSQSGRKHTDETKRQMSESKKREKCYNWQGGKSFEPYLPEFNTALKREIRERDNFTCQECKYTEKKLGYKLSIHHIDYNKTNNNTNNLISLCKSCHSQTNFKRDDWTKYYNNLLKT